MKKRIIKIVMTIAVGLIYILLRIGIERASIETVDVSGSPDGQYTLLLQSRGHSSSRYGLSRRYPRGRIVLEEGTDRIASYDFTLYDNSGEIFPDSWQVTWSEDHATAMLSGSNQADLEVTLTMDGEVYGNYLPGTLPYEEKYLESLRESVPTEESGGMTVMEEPDNGAATEEKVESEEEGEADEAYQLIADGYRAVYGQLFQDKGYDFQEGYDAKGNLRIILSENEEKVEYLMYDRESENGKCGLYVYYSADKNEDGSWAPDQAKILDMYAWVYDTGEVISSGKTGWADSGSEAYRSATGE